MGLLRKVKHRDRALVGSLLRFGLVVYDIVRTRDPTAEIAG
jgi:hypothetical protein